jgi:hypothetical protein
MLQFNQTSLLPDIFYVFKPKDVMKFLKYFGGQQYYIPSAEELVSVIKDMLVDYLIEVEHKSEAEVKELLDITGPQMRYVRTRLKAWHKFQDKHHFLTPEDLKKFKDMVGDSFTDESVASILKER